MTRVINEAGQIWHERDGDVVTIGFVQSFLNGLDQCWHILPANLQRLREKAPLMVIETNDALISIKSPVTANFEQWSDKAQNFPNLLMEDDVIFTLRMGEARRAAPQQPQAAANFVVHRAQRIVGYEVAGRWEADEPAPAAEPIHNNEAVMARIRAEQERLRNAVGQAQPRIRPRGF